MIVIKKPDQFSDDLWVRIENANNMSLLDYAYIFGSMITAVLISCFWVRGAGAQFLVGWAIMLSLIIME